MLKTNEAMRRLGFKDRGAFWDNVYKRGIPFVRYNARNIKFPASGLDEWINRRRSDSE